MLISVKNIDVIYGKKNSKVVALDKVSLDVEEGEFLTIMGKSGCGKSTLLNVLATLRLPTGGQILFDGADLFKKNDKELAKFRNENIGFVVQHFALINEKTVYENIALPLRYAKVNKSEIKERVESLLEKLELSAKINKYPFELSGGQCQRVAIARALVTKPKLILADEPTGALDEENGKNIMDLLKLVNQQGTTVVMVTHDSDFSKYGDRCIHMKDGKITSSTVEI